MAPSDSPDMSDYVESFYFISDIEAVSRQGIGTVCRWMTLMPFSNLRVDGFREYWLPFVRLNN